MGKVTTFFVLCVLFVVHLKSTDGADVIKPTVGTNTRAVAFVHRHGKRNPKASYPKNPCNITFPEGFGALTPDGVEMMIYHGKALRLRYDFLIPSGSEWQNVITVKSSHIKRCIKSAEAILSGLFGVPSVTLPPENVLPKESDNMLAASAECALYDQKLNALFVNHPKDIGAWLNANPNYFKGLSELSGMNLTNCVDAGMTMYGIVLLYKVVANCIPDWGMPFLHDTLFIYERSFSMQYEDGPMQKAKCGALVTDIFNTFDKVIDGSESKKLFEYSAHDNTLSCMSKFFNINEQVAKIPDFGATYSFELDYNQDIKEHTVSLYVWASAYSLFPNLVNFPGCATPCPLSKLKDIYQQTMFKPTETYSSFCNGPAN